MPNTEDACQLKAGHPPAVKVGNMRVVQRTHSTSSNHSDKGEDEKGAAASDSSVPSACSFAPKTVVKTATSGVPDTTQQSVPESVKQFHEKPQVSHEYRGQNARTNVIQQPSKKN